MLRYGYFLRLAFGFSGGAALLQPFNPYFKCVCFPLIFSVLPYMLPLSYSVNVYLRLVLMSKSDSFSSSKALKSLFF